MKYFLLVLILFIFLATPFVSADICEYQEVHECRTVDEKIHAFNGQIDTDCVERGIYEICTAFEHLGVEGICSVEDNVSTCSCTPDIKLFCSTDKLSIVVSNSDCTTGNMVCTTGLYCTENEDPPYNPWCGYYAPSGSNGGGGGGSGGGGGGGDFPTDTSPDTGDSSEETGETITDLIEDLASSITETVSKPENTPYIITIAVLIIIAAASAVYYFKKRRKKEYKGY